ncbi:hypothetical protein GW17_00054856 [Ensete ventricosum]|nr:hypothetical protein GW17_00054856 [Ensete ventricosum]
MGSRTFAQSRAQSQDLIGFSCTISEFQNNRHSRRISPCEIIRARFHEKIRRSYTLCTVARKVEFRSVFRASSRNFKILATPNVLAHGKSYEHGFTKKCNGHKLCTKSRAMSSFDRFVAHCLRISK